MTGIKGEKLLGLYILGSLDRRVSQVQKFKRGNYFRGKDYRLCFTFELPHLKYLENRKFLSSSFPKVKLH